MKLHMIGLDLKHDKNFIINRPEGSGDNLLLIYKTEALVYKNEEKIHVFPNSCIIYKKRTPQHYCACSETYINHFLHFDSCGDSVFSELSLPVDTPFYLQNIEEIESILRFISREQISASPLKESNAGLLLQLLFQKLSENQREFHAMEYDLKHREELTALRSEIYSTPRKYSTVRELADSVNLSLSYFQSLYSTYFGVSCYDDLLTAKIASGKSFLQNSNLSVKEIAFLCGYENDTCFMRCFKKRTGLTPSEYRREK
ncbi:MAG: helix-turn-helix domain-containing protein [Lachnospiraceae bacterium]